jgi:hypothetical protein
MFIIEPSTSPNHRYQVEVYGKMIRFGSPSMDNYWIHKDEVRRKNYLTRSKGIKNKKGKTTRNYPLSKNYWSRKILWSSGEPWLGIDKKYWKLLDDQIEKIRKIESRR